MFKQEVYDWGLTIIRAMQTVSNPALNFFVKGITNFGSPVVAIAVILFIYWCIDRKKGFKLFFLVFVSFAFNIVLKNVLQIPRPFVLDPTINLIAETGFSAPSGHAQASASFWTLFAWVYLKKNKKVSIACAIGIPLVIACTRVYLGVHYPTDVLLGLIIGYLFALGGIFFYEEAATALPKPPGHRLLAAAALCLAFNSLSGNEHHASAVLFGFSVGYMSVVSRGLIGNGTMGDYGENVAQQFTLITKVYRFFIAGIFCCIVYAIPKFIFHITGAFQNDPLVGFAHYAIVGFAAAFSPLVLKRLRVCLVYKK